MNDLTANLSFLVTCLALLLYCVMDFVMSQQEGWSMFVQNIIYKEI